MSTSLLYHAFGLRTYEYIRTEYLNGAIFFHVKKKDGAQYCTKCRSRDVVYAGRVERIWVSLPIGLKPTIIVGHLHRLQCRTCGVTRLESLDIADPRKGYTRAFSRYVVALARHMTKTARRWNGARRSSLSKTRTCGSVAIAPRRFARMRG